MPRIPSQFPNPPLRRADFPWERFRQVCRSGLSAVRPLKDATAPDEFGWNHGSAVAPSYWAYGRMRALLAIRDVLALPGKTLMELASGDGALCAVAADAGRQVTANDLRAEVIREAILKYRNHADIRVLAGNLFELDPEVAGHFDVLVACEVVEHVAHTVDFLAKCRDLVRPGGHVLVTTPNGEFFRNTLPTWEQIEDFKALEDRQFKPDADGHLFLLTPREMAFLGAEAGLELDHIYAWGSPFLTGNAGFHRLAARPLAPLFQAGETFVQWLPAGLRSRLCTALTVVYRKPA